MLCSHHSARAGSSGHRLLVTRRHGADFHEANGAWNIVGRGTSVDVPLPPWKSRLIKRATPSNQSDQSAECRQFDGVSLVSGLHPSTMTMITMLTYAHLCSLSTNDEALLKSGDVPKSLLLFRSSFHCEARAVIICPIPVGTKPLPCRW